MTVLCQPLFDLKKDEYLFKSEMTRQCIVSYINLHSNYLLPFANKSKGSVTLSQST